VNTHVWWYLARATGVMAWVLAAASVLWGMALSTRALGPKPKAPWLLDLHRFLGGLTVLFVAAHVAALVADSYVDFGPRDVLVPMASTWRPGPVAVGIVAMYLLAAVELTSLLKRRLPARVWRAVHLSSYGVYLAASAHFLAAGTDAVSATARVGVVVTGSIMTFFLVYLIVGPGRAASVRAARART
jgi:DMSO/TMAO reductase YedYZ heme-binding membrane subunit